MEWKYFLVCFLLWGLTVSTFSDNSSVKQSAIVKIMDLISHNIYHQNIIVPSTLRIIRYEENSTDFDWTILSNNHVPILNGNKKPLEASIEPKTMYTGRLLGYIELFQYVVLIWISNALQMAQLLETIRITVNTRWDRVIILTPTEDILQQLMENVLVKGLKDKFGLSLENEKIWVDPIVYDNGKMHTIQSVAEIPVRRKMGGNLYGRHLKAAGAQFSPMMYKTARVDLDSEYSGSNVEILRAASHKFNYTFDFVWDLSYGEAWPNGTYSGMFGRVYYPEEGAHVALNLVVDYFWYPGVDFATQTNIVEMIFVTNHPKTKYEWYSFMLQFSPTVWAWIITTYIVLGVVQFIVMFLWHGKKLKYIVWDSAVFLPYSMAMEQGLMVIPKGARYLSLVWLMGCVVLGTGYRSTLRTNLTFPSPEKMPEDFDELANRPEFDLTLFLGLDLGSHERAIFWGSNMPAMINVRKRMQYTNDNEGCIRNTYRGHYSACLAWNNYIRQEIAKCLTVDSRVEPLAFSKNSPKVATMSMAFQKNSIFVDSFIPVTQVLFEGGTVYKWELDETYINKQKGIRRLSKEKHTDIYKKLLLQTQSDKSDNSLKLRSLEAIFFIVPLGGIVSTVLFGIEYIIFNKPCKNW